MSEINIGLKNFKEDVVGVQDVLEIVKTAFPTYHFFLWAVTGVTDPDIPEEILLALNILTCLRDP